MVEIRRGAPRSEAAHLSILRAAAALVRSVGYDKVTIEGIASEAGVAKQTIYRWYPSKSAIITECLMEGLLVTTRFDMPDTDDFAADLTSWLGDVFVYLAEARHAALIGSLVAAAAQAPEITERLAERLGASAPPFADRVARSQRAGEVSADTTAELLSEAIFGVILIRIIGRADFVRDDAAALVRLIVRGAASQAEVLVQL